MWIALGVTLGFLVGWWFEIKLTEYIKAKRYDQAYNDGYTDHQNGKPNKVRPEFK